MAELIVSTWIGRIPEARHWRGEIDGVPVEADWPAERKQKWLERVRADHRLADYDDLLRGCSRNRGGPGPGDFTSRDELIMAATLQWLKALKDPDDKLLLNGAVIAHA